ncbi:MAG TPA: chalcone isomerase family protein [Candidatus Binatia bacterium]|nr:chalcone isomerase family protein [Candidatus Binatia bacterium]
MTTRAVIGAVLAAVVIGLLPVASARSATLAGVEMPDTVVVDGTTLVLNGMGLRQAFLVKAYVGALYLEKRTSDPRVVLDSRAPKQVVLAFLRDIDRGRLSSGWADALRKSGGKAMEPSIAQFTSLIEDVNKGDTMSFTWRPGVGVEVATRGQVRGSVAGDDFARALFGLWFGPKPGDPDLKKGMLGK